MPRLGSMPPQMRPLPRYPNVLVFYPAQGEDLRVIRILHSSRDIARLFSN